jgi:hypothetical protein
MAPSHSDIDQGVRPEMARASRKRKARKRKRANHGKRPNS